MRKILTLAAAILAFASAPAHAQSLDGVMTLLNGGSNVATGYQYNGCQWQRGIVRTICSVQSTVRIAENARRTVRNYQQVERNRLTQIDLRDRRPDVTTQMSARCNDGDNESCRALKSWRAASAAYEKTRREQGYGPSMNLGAGVVSKGSPVPGAIRDLCMRGDQVACQTAYDLGRR